MRWIDHNPREQTEMQQIKYGNLLEGFTENGGVVKKKEKVKPWIFRSEFGKNTFSVTVYFIFILLYLFIYFLLLASFGVSTQVVLKTKCSWTGSAKFGF